MMFTSHRKHAYGSPRSIMFLTRAAYKQTRARHIFARTLGIATASAADPEVPGSIPGATRFSEYQWVWNGVHSALLRINEELLERNVAAPV
jgi:hypothetical protein